jgi:GTP-binding protein
MIDVKTIKVLGGSGGAGKVSFRREKFIPFGGPDGGSGGDGGSVIIRASRHFRALLHLRGKRVFSAPTGGGGGRKRKHGRSGANLVVEVPLGTVIWGRSDEDQRVFLGDLWVDKQELVIARGGAGGRGNFEFVTSVQREPLLGEAGEVGEIRTIVLELKLLADVGIVGLPSAGKSTFLSVVSAAKPEIAAYPFTTIEPVLGVVDVRETRFVMVEIPGLIEGAHSGKGLGLQFLRHVERTAVLLHLVDGEAADPMTAHAQVSQELSMYDPALALKPMVTALTKIDLPHVRERLYANMKALRDKGVNIHGVSSCTGEGVKEVLAALIEAIPSQDKRVPPPTEINELNRLSEQSTVPKIWRDGEVVMVSFPRAERLAAGTDLRKWQARVQLHRELEKMGVIEELEKVGVRTGDTVRIGEVEMEWD